jgi:ParB family chromosome partitioning protein
MTKKIGKLDLSAGMKKGVDVTDTRVTQESQDQADILSKRLASTEKALSTNGTTAVSTIPLSPADLHDRVSTVSPITSNLSGTEQYVLFCQKHNYQPGQIVDWPIDKIDKNPYNPRNFYHEESVARLSLTVASNGQGEAIKATIHDTDLDRIVLWDGERRLRGAKKLRHTTIKVLINDIKSPRDRYVSGYVLNTEKETQSSLDNAIKWRELLEQNVFESQESIAADLKISTSEVSMTLALGSLGPTAIAAMAEQPTKFGLSMAYEVYRACNGSPETETLGFITEIISKDYSIKKVRQLINAKKEKAEPATRKRYNHNFDFKNGTKKIGSIKAYGADRLEFRVEGIDSEVRDNLYEQIREIITAALPHDNLSPEEK